MQPDSHPHLPTEVWVAIFDLLRCSSGSFDNTLHSDPPPDAVTLAKAIQACRLFRTIGEPLLYEQVYCNIRRRPTTPLRIPWETIIRREDMWACIKHLQLNGLLLLPSMPPEGPAYYVELPEMIPHMRNLRTVSLRKCTLEPSVFDRLIQLPRLDAFQSVRTYFHDYNQRILPLETYPTSRLHNVWLVHGDVDVESPEVEPALLPHFVRQLIGPSMRRLAHTPLFAPNIYSHMQAEANSGQSFDQLEEYHLLNANWDVIIHFPGVARACPNLFSIIIEWDSQRDNLAEEMFYAARARIPRLSSLLKLSCPLFLADTFLSGQTVEMVTLHLGFSHNNPTENRGYLKRLERGAASVRRLALIWARSWDACCPEEIGGVFPCLEELVLDFHVVSWT